MHCLLALHGLLQITQCSDARTINCNELRELRAELDKVKGEKKLLSDRVKSLTKELKDRMTVTSESLIVTVKTEASSEPLTEQDDGSGASSQDDGSSSDEESRHTDTNIENRRQLHPPGKGVSRP